MSAATAHDQIRGYVDGIVDGAIQGWVCDRLDPDRRLVLEVALDGRSLGRTVADRRRKDLERAGIGDGRYGFRVAWPDGVELGAEHEVAVTVPGHGLLALAANYRVRDAAGRPVAGVTLRLPRQRRPRQRPAEGPLRVLGSGGMLFEADDDERLAVDRGVSPLGPAELCRLVERLRRRGETLRRAGSALVVAAIPPKLQVYPERLPDGLVALAASTPAGQLAPALEGDRGVTVIDLLPVLRGARVDGKAFLRSRPVVTWTGAAHASRAIVEGAARRCAELAAPPDATVRLGHPRTLEMEALDAAVMIAGRMIAVTIRSGPALVAESDVEIDLGALRAHPVDGAPGERFACPAAGDATALVAVDSGVDCGRIARLLAEHFRQTTVQVAGASLETAEGADVIVHLLDNRALIRLAQG